jgi:hypothetical protein
MGTPSHFHSGGISNVRKEQPLGMMGQLDPTKFHTFFDDFDKYVSGDWTITEVDGGVDGADSIALGNVDGGALVILNNDADDDSEFLQKKGESFLLVAGKKLWFKARLKVSDATQSDFVMGLQITDTTPLAVSDGIFFQKDDGDANLDIHVVKNSTATDSAGVGTVVSDTFIEMAFYYNGVDAIEVFVDDVKVATLAVTNLPDDEELTVSFGVQNGEAAAKSMTVDYIFVAKER